MFPSLINMYDVIYAIKTENYHYIDLKNKKFCDTILICCKNKIFNIFFEQDRNSQAIMIPDSFLKEMYDNKNV
jgi:hypothetical protein